PDGAPVEVDEVPDLHPQAEGECRGTLRRVYQDGTDTLTWRRILVKVVICRRRRVTIIGEADRLPQGSLTVSGDGCGVSNRDYCGIPRGCPARGDAVVGHIDDVVQICGVKINLQVTRITDVFNLPRPRVISQRGPHSLSHGSRAFPILNLTGCVTPQPVGIVIGDVHDLLGDRTGGLLHTDIADRGVCQGPGALPL